MSRSDGPPIASVSRGGGSLQRPRQTEPRCAHLGIALVGRNANRHGKDERSGHVRFPSSCPEMVK